MKKKDLLTTKKRSPMEKVARLVELQALYKQIRPEIQRLKDELLVVMKDLDVETLKTSKYTLYRATLITPHVVDFTMLKQALTKKKIPYKTQVVFADFMNVVFRKFVEEGRKIPGLEGKITEYVTTKIRKVEHGK